ncbi:hypothetical protein E2C01_059695 [Portunus trituberculatus]|uniref:Uncharacterized protein n=1 Tax=Portunus trituberculatus TaxID=210409 RepID=A0A5B7H8H6_PORTR|nr:hypothetical protein [Portunus trituberculatus]
MKSGERDTFRPLALTFKHPSLHTSPPDAAHTPSAGHGSHTPGWQTVVRGAQCSDSRTQGLWKLHGAPSSPAPSPWIPHTDGDTPTKLMLASRLRPK